MEITSHITALSYFLWDTDSQERDFSNSYNSYKRNFHEKRENLQIVLFQVWAITVWKLPEGVQ